MAPPRRFFRLAFGPERLSRLFVVGMLTVNRLLDAPHSGTAWRKRPHNNAAIRYTGRPTLRNATAFRHRLQYYCPRISLAPRH